MAKKKSRYVCQECGYETSGWLGRCPACSKWDTIVEEIVDISEDLLQGISSGKPVKMANIHLEPEERYTTGIKELDRVLGGGVVKASLILIGGDPGIGKSTLVLQLCNTINIKSKILYVSGEESIKQIKMRADRLKVDREDLLIVSETNFEAVEQMLSQEVPDILIIDSIQTIFTSRLTSAPGSVGQVREVTAQLMHIAKGRGISIIVVGHVTKEGMIAGPRVLEHMVDTVLYFEGERHLNYRILRAVKNRFGSTNEIGIFEMHDTGLKEVENPSKLLLAGRAHGQSGSSVVASMEGTRPMLLEVQALVCPTSFGVPRRMATGLDYNRITMLIAVLEKKVGMQLHNFDAYINVVGGIKINEPAGDLGVVAAVASSFRNLQIDAETLFVGEVGLTGEVRAVSYIQKRLVEAARLGFKKCIVPAGNMQILKDSFKDIDVVPVSNVSEVLNKIF